MNRLPVLVVGDVHGDLQRLFQALRPYPPDQWETLFLGDLVNRGPFGVGALRYARDRPHSTVLLGNHEVALLQAARDPAARGSFLSVGGQLHDLQELRRDEPLQEWLRERPGMLKLEDGTLAQHSGHDGYGQLIDHDEPDPVAAINARIGELLRKDGEDELWYVLSPKDHFRDSRPRLEAWLRRTGARRLLHGHTPHRRREPDAYHDGLAINFDGGFFTRRSPVRASVSPLAALPLTF